MAFDQRGALKRMMAAHQDTEPAPWQIEALKALVSEELTPYASSILLDPEYGLPATKVRDEKSGLLLAMVRPKSFIMAREKKAAPNIR
ncbi:tagatose 1,6-diphosphate aldolase [Streptococcus equi subsp. equi]|nr:tagatose 1,6-diphosphate aldolase [Streptococcus equi subsp. equi]